MIGVNVRNVEDNNELEMGIGTPDAGSHYDTTELQEKINAISRQVEKGNNIPYVFGNRVIKPIVDALSTTSKQTAAMTNQKICGELDMDALTFRPMCYYFDQCYSNTDQHPAFVDACNKVLNQSPKFINEYPEFVKKKHKN